MTAVTIPAALKAREKSNALATVGAKIFGVVLNNVDLRREGYDNYYYNRYYSNYSENADTAAQ